MLRVNVCSDSCCGISGEDFCKCGNKGHAVKEITVKTFVKEKLDRYDGFFFCSNPECDTVYFNKKRNIYITKDKITTEIGLKKKNPPKKICYCFDFYIEDVVRDRKGVIENISRKIKEYGCECEIKNPSGRCCLTDIRNIGEEI